MSEFPCTGCSLCCRAIGAILAEPNLFRNLPIVVQAVKDFPYKADANGVCEKLVDNRCSVYEKRPLLCNIRELGVLLGYSTEEWYRLNAETCNQLIRAAGLDESYLINDYDRNQ